MTYVVFLRDPSTLRRLIARDDNVFNNSMPMRNFFKNPFFLLGLILGIILVAWLVMRDNGEVAGEQVQNEPLTNVQLLEILSDDHVRGPATAPVKLVIYSDFECPFCATYAATVGEAQKAFGEKVAVIFRHYPLDFHAYALRAAEASECAAAQGKFWEIHDALFGRTAAGGLAPEAFSDSAQALGLDVEGFNQCMAERRYAANIVSEIAQAEQLTVSATPTTFINGNIQVGALPWEDYETEEGTRPGLKSLIERELE